MDLQRSRYDVEVQKEIAVLKAEYSWLLETEGIRVFHKVDELLKECCRRMPLPNKVSPHIVALSGAGLQSERFLISSINSDAVRCTLTILGDNVVQVDVTVRHPKSPGQLFRSTAQPDIQWKIQQIQDVCNHMIKAVEAVSAALAHCTKLARDRLHSQPKKHIVEMVDLALSNLQSARACLMLPKKRSLAELINFAPNKCFNPPLPNDLLLSIYVNESKFICAAYLLQNPSSANSKQTFLVNQGECAVGWLGELVTLLAVSTQIVQEFRDKLTIFYNNESLKSFVDEEDIGEEEQS